ncbi:MAG: hypothetical protein HXX08_23250 [Chloroflexi bacterium]|uniref:Uncharacterized protein n=1 Tax=Candidatus Chlorohelix allophototropha TaxID=3003348 RepID=A0A8T7M9T8_9CHLR|nr:hypothetical protein [Chloroflexota bacterium]NWJ48786.1 hypothetical protein [Chloroflexota bacterium]WJW68717.1 hypothetical protein OZ401_004333 [Chloroflexota bacterium L227-S17]
MRLLNIFQAFMLLIVLALGACGATEATLTPVVVQPSTFTPTATTSAITPTPTTLAATPTIAATPTATTLAATEIPTPEGPNISEKQIYEQMPFREKVTGSRDVTVAGVKMKVNIGYIGDLAPNGSTVLAQNKSLTTLKIAATKIAFSDMYTDAALQQTLALYFGVNSMALRNRLNPSWMDTFDPKTDPGAVKYINNFNLNSGTSLEIGSQRPNRTKMKLSEVKQVSVMITSNEPKDGAVSAIPGLSTLYGVFAHPLETGYEVIMTISLDPLGIAKMEKNWNTNNDPEVSKELPALEIYLNWTQCFGGVFNDMNLRWPTETTFAAITNAYAEVGGGPYSKTLFDSKATLEQIVKNNLFKIPYLSTAP